MPHMKLFGPAVRCVLDDDFDLLAPKKSIAKKAKNEIVLSRTGAMLDIAEIDVDRAAASRGKEIIDRQSNWMSLQELSRMRNT